MTDPFLRSPADDELAAETQAAADEDLLRRSGLPRAVFDLVPREHIEQFVTRVESWAELADDLDDDLNSAGFQRHEIDGPGGGFHIATWLRDDGVIVSWSLRGPVDPHEANPMDDKIRAIMGTAIAQILTAYGYNAQVIPADEDDANCVLVTGRIDPHASHR